ncbi:Transporter, partial [Giardia duodenalis]
VDWEQKLVINIILNRESELFLFYLTKFWKIADKPRCCNAQPF